MEAGAIPFARLFFVGGGAGETWSRVLFPREVLELGPLGVDDDMVSLNGAVGVKNLSEVEVKRTMTSVK